MQNIVGEIQTKSKKKIKPENKNKKPRSPLYAMINKKKNH